MATTEAPAPLDRLVQLGSMAADNVAIGFVGTGAERTKASVREALQCLLANGLIQMTPIDQWPEYVALDPPYQLPF